MDQQLERRRGAARAATRRAAGQAWVRPVADERLTSDYGYRWGRLHAGVDFGVRVGAPVRAMSSGTVTATTHTMASGNRIEIRYWDGSESYYFHLSARMVRPGQRVSPGEVVGRSGNTGRSTGPHLHLEIHPGGGKPINPLPWLVHRGLAAS